jgi:hypothetical protein
MAHGLGQEYPVGSSPVERSSAMDTPPCSLARRAGLVPGGACADTPSGCGMTGRGFSDGVPVPARQVMTHRL